MQVPRKLMCILAHPDDESIALGGTLAKYAAEGVEISLVIATRGERGWFSDWELYPGAQALGALREQEVRNACEVLGISRLDFLDYMDGDVDQINEAEIIARLVRLLREVRPQVVVTFGPDGLYGHPDHIAISQFTTSALLCAADQHYVQSHDLAPHSVSKLYYRISTADWFTRCLPILGEMVMLIDGRERRAHPWVNWIVTTRIDTSAYWQRAWQAVLCHQTQLPDKACWQALAEQDHQEIWGPQEYYRALSLVNSGRKEEHDLFEGVPQSAQVAPGFSHTAIYV